MDITVTLSDSDIDRLADAIAARIGGGGAEAKPVEPKHIEPLPLAVSLGDLRGAAKALVGRLGAPGRDALAAILAENGAKNLTTLDDSRYAEVKAAIEGVK